MKVILHSDEDGTYQPQVAHTPGPWGIGGSLIVNGNTVIARVLHRGNTFKDQDNQAPARFSETTANLALIASAPELLAAARLLMKAQGMVVRTDDDGDSRRAFDHAMCEANDAASAAIAKAEGK